MERIGELLAMANGLMFAFSNIFNKRALDEMDADTGMIITLLVNNLINALGLFVLYLGGHRMQPVRGGIVWFVLAGIATSFVGRHILFASVRINGPSRAGSYKVASPVFTTAIGLLILGEKVSAEALAGVGICLVGIWIISLRHIPGRESRPRRKNIGLMVGLGSALAYATGMATRKVGLGVWPSAVAGAQIGSLTALVVTLISIPLGGGKIAWAKMLLKTSRNFYYSGICTGLAILSFFFALKFTTVVIANAVAALEPLFTVALSYLILHRQEEISSALVVGALLVTVGVVTIFVF